MFAICHRADVNRLQVVCDLISIPRSNCLWRIEWKIFWRSQGQEDSGKYRGIISLVLYWNPQFRLKSQHTSRHIWFLSYLIFVFLLSCIFAICPRTLANIYIYKGTCDLIWDPPGQGHSKEVGIKLRSIKDIKTYVCKIPRGYCKTFHSTWKINISQNHTKLIYWILPCKIFEFCYNADVNTYTIDQWVNLKSPGSIPLISLVHKMKNVQDTTMSRRLQGKLVHKWSVIWSQFCKFTFPWCLRQNVQNITI